MTFHCVSCKLCETFIFKIDELMAFGFKDGSLVPVDLEGQQPWSGIRCVCDKCGTMIARAGGWTS